MCASTRQLLIVSKFTYMMMDYDFDPILQHFLMIEARLMWMKNWIIFITMFNNIAGKLLKLLIYCMFDDKWNPGWYCCHFFIQNGSEKF